MNRTALITGASGGIGAAFARVFASNGFDLVVTGRREARLRELAADLARDHHVAVHVIPADLVQPGAVAALCGEIASRNLTIDALVNSAGFGVAGTFARAGWASHHDMLRLMVVAPSELTHSLLPGMIQRAYGRIVNVASLAGLAPAGAGTTYGAAKAFAVSFSVSLARELAKQGVHVTAVCPGLTRTAFHEAPGMRDTVRQMPGWMWMDPQTVARQGYAAVMSGTPVCVNGGVNRLMVAFLRYVPRPLVAAAAGLVRFGAQRRRLLVRRAP